MLGSFFGSTNRAALPLLTSGFPGAVSCVTFLQNTATYADIQGRMNAFVQLSAFAVFARVCCAAKPVRVCRSHAKTEAHPFASRKLSRAGR
jgi:hypothetical protein